MLSIMQMSPRQMRRYLARSIGGTALSGRRIARSVTVDTVKTVLRKRTEASRHQAIVKSVKGFS